MLLNPLYKYTNLKICIQINKVKHQQNIISSLKAINNINGQSIAV